MMPSTDCGVVLKVVYPEIGRQLKESDIGKRVTRVMPCGRDWSCCSYQLDGRVEMAVAIVLGFKDNMVEYKLDAGVCKHTMLNDNCWATEEEFNQYQEKNLPGKKTCILHSYTSNEIGMKYCPRFDDLYK